MSRRGPAVTSVVVGAALLLALLGFGLTRDPSAAGASQLSGRPAPPLVIRTLDDGRMVRLADLRGHVVVVNFFASWCAECREEHGQLRAAWERYRDQGVVVLGVAFQDTPEAARTFQQEMGGDWPAGVDQGSAGIDFGVTGVPETFFVAPDGTVAGRHVGPVTYALLTERISALLAQGRR